MHHVVSDVHGHRAELVSALRGHGLLDAAEGWAGGQDTLWFLGDLFDRGPDGVGVLELVMALQGQAQAAGGQVRALLGNHEVLTMGMHLFGDSFLDASDGRSHNFAHSWALNGGVLRDQRRLTAVHLEWLRGLPALAREGRWLLLHSDTLDYLSYGDTPQDVNDAVGQVLSGDDPRAWWDLWHRLTTRYAFLGPGGPASARRLLQTLGGERVVHGHSIIASLVGTRPDAVHGPLRYADGTVLAVDGGLHDGGPCLVVGLEDHEPDAAARP